MRELSVVVLGQLLVSFAFASGGAAPQKALLETSGENPAIQEKAHGRDIEKSLNKMWFGKYEPDWVRVLAYGPRVIGNDLMYLATGETANRIGNTAATVRYAVTGEMRTAAMRSAESVLNPLGDFEGVVSDGVTLATSPLWAGFRTTSRVQTCTMNLFNIFFPAPNPVNQINPTKHVGFVVDKNYESHDPGGGGFFLEGNVEDGGTLVCKASPVRDNVSNSLAIERLYCMDHTYGAAGWSSAYEDSEEKKTHVDYDFLMKNCGAYTKAALEGSGFAFPSFPNVGIGLDSFNLVERKTWKNAQAKCDSHIAKVKSIIGQLEQGETLSSSNAEYLKLGAVTDTYNARGEESYGKQLKLAPDTIVQLFISAARGRNAANRELVAANVSPAFSDVVYYDDKELTKVRSAVSQDLLALMSGIDTEAKAWLAKTAPTFSKLQDDVTAQYTYQPPVYVYQPDLSNHDFEFNMYAQKLRIEGVGIEPVLAKRTITGECDVETSSQCDVEDVYAKGDVYTVQLGYDEDSVGESGFAESDTHLVDVHFTRAEIGEQSAQRLDAAMADLKAHRSGRAWVNALNQAKAVASDIFAMDNKTIQKPTRVIDENKSTLCDYDSGYSCTENRVYKDSTLSVQHVTVAVKAKK